MFEDWKLVINYSKQKLNNMNEIWNLKEKIQKKIRLKKVIRLNNEYDKSKIKINKNDLLLFMCKKSQHRKIAFTDNIFLFVVDVALVLTLATSKVGSYRRI